MSDTELLPKSKPEPVRRVEVFTGTGRRRAWAADEKAQIVADSHAGGEMVSAVARRHESKQGGNSWHQFADRGASHSGTEYWKPSFDVA